MTLSVSTHARSRTRERSCYDSPEDVLFATASLLEKDDIADYILGEITIGGAAVIIDEDTGRSYSLQVLQDEIIVKTVFYQTDSGVKFIAVNDEFTILLKNARVVFADLYHKMSRSACLTY